jgi:predicted MFS family arabinose efflux permease
MESLEERPWSLAVGGLIALAVAMGMGRFVYTPILPFMAESLPLTKAEAGLIASANYLGYLLGALVAATSWIRGSRRFWFMAGLVASAATTLLTAAPSSVLLLSAVRLLGGIASAFVLVFASSLVLERLAAAGQSRLAAVHFGGVGIGIALSAALVALLAAAGHGWRAQWIGTGCAALLAIPAVAALVPPDRGAAGPAVRSAPVTVTGRLLALVTAYGLFGFGYVITATFLIAIVRGSPEIRHLESAAWILVGLAGLPSVALWSALGRRLGVFTAFALACLVEAVGVLASVLTASIAGLAVAATFLGGTFVGITALGLFGARTLSASDPRRVLALMTVAFGLGQIVGPIFAGAVVDRTGSFLLPSLCAAAALAVAAVLSWSLDLLSRRRRRDRNAPAADPAGHPP